MKNGIVFKEKIIPFFTILLGLFLILMSLKTFIYSIDLYKIYRVERDFNGCFYGAHFYLPFYEFIISIVLLLYGVILIKRNNFIFKALIIFSLSTAVFYVLSSIFTLIYCIIMNCYSDYKILEIGGILFFTLLISEYYKYDWKIEIKNFGYKKILISVIIIFIINRTLDYL